MTQASIANGHRAGAATDAEGRLVLADGLHYAKTLGCTHLIDAATLTGACVVALGGVNAGVFGRPRGVPFRSVPTEYLKCGSYTGSSSIEDAASFTCRP